MRMPLKISLPVIQIAVATVLLSLGANQTSHGSQDNSPFVATATKVCEAINAPASVFAAGSLGVLGRFLGVSQVPAGEWLFIVGVAVLWFLVGWEIESKESRRVFSGARFVASCVAVGSAVVLVRFGITEWQQGEAILALGALVWSLMAGTFYAVVLIRSIFARLTT